MAQRLKASPDVMLQRVQHRQHSAAVSLLPEVHTSHTIPTLSNDIGICYMKGKWETLEVKRSEAGGPADGRCLGFDGSMVGGVIVRA